MCLEAKDSRLKPFKYPVFPCFREWRFPHQSLPPSWHGGSFSSAICPSDSEPGNVSKAVALRDVSCRVSDHREGCEKAHLCPRSEATWFLKNGMQHYINNQFKPVFSAIDDPANVILMREDLHTSFDQHGFVFVPKAAENEAPNLVIHLLKDSQELGKLYHNTKLHSIEGVAPEFLFTRLAWSVFPLLQGFLAAGVSRDLLLSTGECRTMSPVECSSYLMQSGMESQNGMPSTVSPSNHSVG